MQFLTRLDHTEISITAQQMKHPPPDIPSHPSSCHWSLLYRFSVLQRDLSSHRLQPDVKDGVTYLIWVVLPHLIWWLTLIQQLCLQPVERLKLVPNDIHRSCGSKWISKSVSKDQSSSPVSRRLFAWQQLRRDVLQKHFLSLCWPQDLCSWREADDGNLRGFREPRVIFPTGVAEKKRREKILKLSLMLHIFRFYDWKWWPV